RGWTRSRGHEATEPHQGDLAQLALPLLQLGRWFLLHPPAQLGKDLLAATAAREDQKHVAEALLIPTILGRERGQRCGGGLHGLALLPHRARWHIASALADPRVRLHRLEPLVVGELVHGMLRRLAGRDRARPAPAGEAAVQPVL